MRLLGAILAGGRSTRFGGDKAAALLAGKPLIEHVADALRPQVDALVVVGRAWPGLTSIPDRPASALGPLGGLCGALHHAQAHGFDAVLTAGCDVLPVPADLARRLGTAPAVAAGQRLFGLWPATLADKVERHLLGPDHSVRSWIVASGAHEIRLDRALHNLNTAADLALYSAAQGVPR